MNDNDCVESVGSVYLNEPLMSQCLIQDTEFT